MTIEIRIMDNRSKEVLKPVYKTRQLARRACDRLDYKYGAYKYQAVLFDVESKTYQYA